ncbi:hypothetical protein R2F25_38390 [Streptomyces sp. UP1A-1]|nr:hypothetical protein [Streptomyces sp. UP1A-1]
MADIGDDVATLRNHSEGIDDQDRMRHLQELVQRVEEHKSEDLQADLRRIVDETAWLEEQFSNPDLPYDTQRTRSWASAAHRKAQRALAHPDFQHGSTGEPADDAAGNGEAPEAPSATPAAVDEFAAVRQRYDGEMVPASEIRLGDWVHAVWADPVYNELAHMVGRVIGITPVLSNGQRRIEVETRLTLKGKETVRTEFAMINASDLVERLPEGNPGREDSSDLERRIEGELGRHHASKVPVPEGWQAVDGSQIQPRPGDRFRIVARQGGGSGPNGGREHMNITVERPAEREGYWRVRNQPLSFRPTDIVAIPDDASDANTNVPDVDGPDSVPGVSGQAAAPRVSNVGPARFANVDQVRDRWKRGDLDPATHASLTAANDSVVSPDTPTLEMSEGGRLAILRSRDEGGATAPNWWVIAPGSTEMIARAYSREDALAQARIFEGIRDADGNPFPWDAPDATERARMFRSSDGDSLATAVAKELLARGENEGVHELWRSHAHNYLVSKRDHETYYDQWRARQEADGYTIPLDPADTQAGDDVTVLDAYPGPLGPGPRRAGVTSRAQLRESGRPDTLGRGAFFPYLVDSHWSLPTAETPEISDEQADKTRRALIRSLRFRHSVDRPEAFRRPRPGEREDANQSSGGRGSDPQSDQDEGQQNNAQNNDRDDDQNNEDRGRRRDNGPDPDGDAADPDGEPEGGGTEPPEGPGNSDGPDDDGPDSGRLDDGSDDDGEQNAPEEEEDNDERRCSVGAAVIVVDATAAPTEAAPTGLACRT